MRFVNVTEETYEKLVDISKETEQPVSKVIDDIIEGFKHFSNLAFMQHIALTIANQIIDDVKGEEE